MPERISGFIISKSMIEVKDANKRQDHLNFRTEIIGV
jgi:hypothetical protein